MPAAPAGEKPQIHPPESVLAKRMPRNLLKYQRNERYFEENLKC